MPFTPDTEQAPVSFVPDETAKPKVSFVPEAKPGDLKAEWASATPARRAWMLTKGLIDRYGEGIEQAFTPSEGQPKLPLAPNAESAAGQIVSGAYNAAAGIVNSLPTAGTLATANPVGLAYTAPHFVAAVKDSAVHAKEVLSNPNASLQSKAEAVSGFALGAAGLAAGAVGVVKAAPMLRAKFVAETPEVPAFIDKIAPASETAKTLADAEKVFEPIPDEKPPVLDRIKALPEQIATNFQNVYLPISRLEEQVTGNRPKVTLGDRFSLVAGAAGKAEAGIYALDQAQKSLIPDVPNKDVNSFFFLRRTFDRLEQQEAAPEGAPSRAVADWTKGDAQSALAELKDKLGEDKLARLETFAQEVQRSSDADLRLMVDSGRMSERQYAQIKATNDFYAPFRVMKFLADADGVERGGTKSIDTRAEYTKAIQGIDDQGFRLGDILTAVKQNKVRAQILADKNLAMLDLAELTKSDPDGRFIREIPDSAEAPRGFDTVNFMRDGFPRKLAVAKPVADAVRGLDPVSLGIVGTYLSKAAAPFRLGATGMNVGFQLVNQFADATRFATMSKYGVRHAADLYRFPMDFLSAMATSWKSNVFGVKNDLALDYLNSGAARSTIQSQLTPDTFSRIAQEADQGAAAKLMGVARTAILDTPAKIGNAIEETTKMLGMKRALRFTNLEGVTDAQHQKALQEIAYEVRNYAGSPDFAKHGKVGRELNLIFMFGNARLQGAAADLRRLIGRTGGAEGAAAAARLATAIGIPTAAVWYFNNQPENAADYALRPDTEKQNYWLIPRYRKDGAPLYFSNEEGERVREYWRIPKRDIMASIATTIEGGLDFAKTKDPQAMQRAGTAMIENLSPVQITGSNFAERGESVISGTNPLIKAPVEFFLNRNTGQHRPIVPDRLIAASPELQVTRSTLPEFSALASKIPQWMPDRMRSPIHLQTLTQNLTGSMLTQFMKQPQDGRSPWVNSAIIGRFFSAPYTNNAADWDKFAKLKTAATDDRIRLENSVNQFLDAAPYMSQPSRTQAVLGIVGTDPKRLEAFSHALKDRVTGATALERAVRQLPNKERAQFIADKLAGTPDPGAKRVYLTDLARKGVITEETAKELGSLGVRHSK